MFPSICHQPFVLRTGRSLLGFVHRSFGTNLLVGQHWHLVQVVLVCLKSFERNETFYHGMKLYEHCYRQGYSIFVQIVVTETKGAPLSMAYEKFGFVNFSCIAKFNRRRIMVVSLVYGGGALWMMHT